MLRAVLRRLGQLREFGNFVEYSEAPSVWYVVLQSPMHKQLGARILLNDIAGRSFAQARTAGLATLLRLVQSCIAKEIA